MIQILEERIVARMNLTEVRALRILLGQLSIGHGPDSNVRSDQFSEEEWKALQDIYQAFKELGV